MAHHLAHNPSIGTFLGIDLGATNIAAALVDARGTIVRQAGMPTQRERTACEIVEDMTKLAFCLLKEGGLREQDITAAGVGVPGLVVPETGIVYQCPNLSWHELPLRDMLQERLALPLYIANDANCAALAELHAGAFRGRQNAVLITLGSGVGGGVILGGKLYTGAQGAAGEIGHIVIHPDGEPCACGNRGCFERYASADALTRTPSRIPFTAKEVVDAAKTGAIAALNLFNDYVANLAIGIVSIINLYDPEVVALGGGISQAGDFLLEAVRKEVAKRLPFKGYPSAEIVLAALGNEAGPIGAALYAAQSEGAVS